MPRELGPVIFQSGLHPYVNIALNLLVGGLIFARWLWNADPLYSQSRFYRFLIFVTSLFLIFITFLQTQFVNSSDSFLLQMGAAVLAVFTIFLFGRVIPTSLPPARLVEVIKKLAVVLCWLSFILFFISPDTCFKGGRFIGIFKHIPHMVSTATIACFTLFYFIFSKKLNRKQLYINWFHFALCFYLLLLTGTRSSLAAVALGLFLAMVVFGSKSDATRVLKFSLALTGFLVVIFFGDSLSRYAIGVARGEESIGQRAAQDGIESRWQEVQRGYEIFEKDQWLGQGLLSKFSSANEADISNYNANKDPHNIFISAGVIGGWVFIVLTLIAFAAVGLAALKSLRSKSDAIKLLAIYVLTHLPILFIYHIHLSIGGIADRFYWIAFGYMALKENDLHHDEPK
ncbi:MAG: O-antigen ligase family protein [Bdellovibrionaceae bacterium]|nr:O-antigen ligase family protein [Bdellovibrio sp.]